MFLIHIFLFLLLIPFAYKYLYKIYKNIHFTSLSDFVFSYISFTFSGMSIVLFYYQLIDLFAPIRNYTLIIDLFFFHLFFLVIIDFILKIMLFITAILISFFPAKLFKILVNNKREFLKFDKIYRPFSHPIITTSIMKKMFIISYLISGIIICSPLINYILSFVDHAIYLDSILIDIDFYKDFFIITLFPMAVNYITSQKKIK